MRTTLDIPDPLARRVKLTAVQRGVTMKELIVAALEHELSPQKAAKAGELAFPLLPGKASESYDLDPDEISAILVREEAAAYEAAQRS